MYGMLYNEQQTSSSFKSRPKRNKSETTHKNQGMGGKMDKPGEQVSHQSEAVRELGFSPYFSARC